MKIQFKVGKTDRYVRIGAEINGVFFPDSLHDMDEATELANELREALEDIEEVIEEIERMRG